MFKNKKKCNIGYFWNINNCKCQMKKLAKLINIDLKIIQY